MHCKMAEFWERNMIHKRTCLHRPKGQIWSKEVTGNSQTLLLIVKMRSTWAGMSAKVTVNGHVCTVVYNYDHL